MIFNPLYRLLFFLCLAVSFHTAVLAQEPVPPQRAHSIKPTEKPTIRVGGYQFAPYVDLHNGHYTGLTLDIIDALNQIQQEVIFEFTITSIEHRYKAYALGRFDMLIFENPTRGWHNINYHFIPLHMLDGEVLIALNAKAQDQHYFKNLTGKSIAIVKGYHYRFANFKTSPDTLSLQFNPLFVNNNTASIQSVLRGRADIAPVTHSYLQYYLKMNPQDKPLLLIADKWDQAYDNGILLNPQSVLDEKQLSHWIKLLINNGKLSELAAEYAITLKQ